MPIACNATLRLGTLSVQVTASKTTAIRNVANRFGDGYAERRRDGINARLESWQLATPPADLEQVLALEEELAALGVGRFSWAPPGEEAERWWRLEPVAWSRSYSTGDLASITFSIERAN